MTARQFITARYPGAKVNRDAYYNTTYWYVQIAATRYCPSETSGKAWTAAKRSLKKCPL